MTTQDIIKAATILREGGLVAFPTETVYGLGADARNEIALRKIFQAKERPYDNPIIVHIAKVEQLGDWAREIPSVVQLLAKAFWPGGLTLILKKQATVSAILTGNQDTVGIRIPAHPIALELLNTFGSGIAAPSANKFTHISPTTAAAVYEELNDKIDLILDGGECAVGLESTILDMSGGVPTILRPGMISAAEIAIVLGVEVRSRNEKSSIRAPGMHHLHYAPLTKTRLIKSGDVGDSIKNIAGRFALLTHTPLLTDTNSAFIHIQMPNDAQAYAHDLYRTLRELDHQELECILIEEVPEKLEWEAIKDRLSKAAR